MFNALVLDEKDGKVGASFQSLDEATLPPGDVTVDVTHSTLNYKDGLILNGIGRLVRKYPHVPGVDFAGTVAASQSPHYKAGDKVDPDRLARRRAALGRLCAEGARESRMAGADAGRPDAAARDGDRHGRLHGDARGDGPRGARHQREGGEVLVTGAAGGVGSVAVAILAKLGYQVAASTGRAEQADYLKSLGAATIVPRAELAVEKPKPLTSERWNYAIDTVGGAVLANVLARTRNTAPASPRAAIAGGNELGDDGTAVHPARRRPDRRRFGDAALRRPQGGVGPAGARPADGQARRDDRASPGCATCRSWRGRFSRDRCAAAR